jgi:hypothetical protein
VFIQEILKEGSWIRIQREAFVTRGLPKKRPQASFWILRTGSCGLLVADSI